LADFFTDETLMRHRQVGSNAVGCSSRADAVIHFCCVHCSNYSQCFTGRDNPKISPFGQYVVHWAQPSLPSNRHLDRFNRFCRAH